MVQTVLKEATEVGERPQAETPTGFLIAAPFYRNEQLVAPFTEGLLKCASEIQKLGARIVFYNDSPDYPALAVALDDAVARARGTIEISIQTNPQNKGWLKTANAAMAEALALHVDLFLFNSDTVMFPGALSEMLRVARLDPMIGFVNPRSNNATLASFPIGERFRTAEPDAAAAAHRDLSPLLPELTYTPTAVGFAVLIRKNILSEFGFFDEAYGGGYNEENDLVMRAARCGYRAVIANRAFVWHKGEQSFEGDQRKSVVETTNGALLRRRYPEYERLVQTWFDGLDHRGELLISQLAPDADGKISVAFDFSSFGPYHSGTLKAGVQLAASAAELWRDTFRVSVLCTPDTYAFHKLDALGLKRFDPHGPELFAAIFRMGQPFDWDTLRRLAVKGAVVGIFMLDTISLDCSHLYDPMTVNLWHSALSNSDFIIWNSEFTGRQFALRFPDIKLALQRASLHSLDYNDYQPTASPDEPVSPDIANLADGYILVFGNQYPHKAVGHIANQLAESFPHTQIVALGVTTDGFAVAGSPGGLRHPAGQQDNKLVDRDNLRGFRVGTLSDPDMETLYQKAKLVVMPSHYEGFGLPVVQALALRKPVIARRIPSLVEISRGLGDPPNLHFFDTSADLMRIVENAPTWRACSPPAHLKGDAERAANDVREMIEQALQRATYERIQARFRDVHIVFSMARNVPGTRAEFAAQRMGQMMERVFRAMFRLPGVFELARGLFRIVDTIRRR